MDVGGERGSGNGIRDLDSGRPSLRSDCHYIIDTVRIFIVGSLLDDIRVVVIFQFQNRGDFIAPPDVRAVCIKNAVQTDRKMRVVRRAQDFQHLRITGVPVYFELIALSRIGIVL